MGKRIHIFSVVTILLMVGGMAIAKPISNVTANANSAQTHWEGVDAMGAVVVDEECPIEVQHEKLVFDIPQFPSNYYPDIEDFAGYNASVSATYTFYNPADYTVKATLAFPFGAQPYYVPYVYDEERDASVPYSDTDKFAIMVDGQEIEKELRYTLAGVHGGFDLSECLPYLGNTFVEDEFYKRNTTVTKYCYEVSGIPEDIRSAYASFYHTCDSAKTRIWRNTSGGVKDAGDGLYTGGFVENGEILTIYALGEPLPYEPAWKIYENAGMKKEIAGSVIENVSKRDTLTFEEFAFLHYFGEFNAQSNISQVDWYNAVIYSLNQAQTDYGYIDFYDYYGDMPANLMRWYQYDIEIPAKGTLVNTVTAPIYPSIDLKWEPSIFEYTYLWSPAKTWKKFGKLDIEIHTPYYLINNNTFEKTETGYALSLDGLPEDSGELVFTLSTDENPKRPLNASGCLYGCMFAFLLPYSLLDNAIGCSSVVGICAGCAPILLTAGVLLFKKRK